MRRRAISRPLFGSGFLPGLTVVVLSLGALACGSRPETTIPSPPPGAGGAEIVADFVGVGACVRCHQTEYALWRGSHHDLAMQEVSDRTVLGDFDGARFTYNGVTSTFFRRDGAYWVRTDGADGALTDFEIAYVFGVDPLQQYLIAFPDGRLQALSICWDTRPAEDGGQRWYHLYPDEAVDYEDPLHWTGRQQNWNYMCAECHSTHLEKNYDAATDRYATTWSEIDVSCEACHGPGSSHVDWAEQQELEPESRDREVGERGVAEPGLTVSLKDEDGGVWLFPDVEAGIAVRSAERTSDPELEACARCHSLRSPLTAEYVHGSRLADHYRPSLLVEGLYHADGQILEEVYVYGSFLQSRMYAAGVACGDCHDPHSAELRVTTNDRPDAVCGLCHLVDKFAAREHHFHPPDSTGASCVECHMPSRNYMIVDARGDHSFRIPRPDLSLELGTPDACSRCHEKESVEWSAQAFARWYPEVRGAPGDYPRALHAARAGAVDAEVRLEAAMTDPETPAIVRATAAELMAASLDRRALAALETGLGDEDHLVRSASVRTLSALPIEERTERLADSLGDPVRLVRIDAARSLASAPETLLSAVQAERRAAGLIEFRTAQRVAQERPEALMNLSTLEADLGNASTSEELLLKALEIDPLFTPAYANLADLYRSLDRDDLGEALLRRGLARQARDAVLHHLLGLLLVRRERPDEALSELRRAAELGPGDSRFAYVYAVALHSAGDRDSAIAVLEETHERAPGNRDVLGALAAYHAQAGETERARGYVEKLASLDTADSQPSAR